jgi:hypothetical protein
MLSLRCALPAMPMAAALFDSTWRNYRMHGCLTPFNGP